MTRREPRITVKEMLAWAAIVAIALTLAWGIYVLVHLVFFFEGS